MRMTTVVHLRTKSWSETPAAQRVRIDRTTEWGNPFRIDEGRTREEAIAAYREHLRAHPALVERARRELRGKVLGCWCAPQACHGEVLADVADGAEP